MATHLQPRLHEIINRKRSDLEKAITRHEVLRIGIDRALERRSDSLSQRLIDFESLGAVIERLYADLVFLSDVAGITPPRKPVIY
jgi:hypothetical protein